MMRIAVSGTHSMGKSTLAEDFIENHPEFALEVEPYHVLQEQFGIDFAEEPTQESFITQLEYCLERTNAYERKDNVIFDRCPIDYIAYREDIYGLFSGQQPEVVELWGNRKSRLARLESLIS